MTASEVTWEWSDETVAAPRGATRWRRTVLSDSGGSTRGDAEVRGGSLVAANGQTLEAACKRAGEHAVVMRSQSRSQETLQPAATRSNEGEAMEAGTV